MPSPEASEPGAGGTDLDLVEREFVASMDAIQDYMQLQAKLQDQLKQGLLSLARAKYSMGPIGEAQYDLEMRASARVAVSSDMEAAPPSSSSAGAPSSVNSNTSSGRYRFALQRLQPEAAAAAADAADAATAATAEPSKPEPGQKGTGTAGQPPPAAAPPSATAGAPMEPAAKARSGAAAGAGAGGREEVVDFSDGDDDEDGSDEADEGLREANEFLRRMRMQAEAEAKAGGDSGDNDGGGEHGAAAGQRRLRGRRRRGGDPLQWFGVLVPPALKEAQGQFKAALETCMQLANTAQRVAAVAPVSVPAPAPATSSPL